MSVLLGDGAGGFGGPSHIQIGAANLEFDATATLADIDGDKNLDILYTNAADPQVVLLPGKGDGTFPQQVKIPVGTLPTSLQLFDWNGDGKLDLTVCDYGDDAVGILLNTSR